MTALLVPRETPSLFSPDLRRRPTVQRYFLEELDSKSPMQDAYRARDSSPSTLSAFPSPTFMPVSQPLAYPLNNLPLEDEMVFPSYDRPVRNALDLEEDESDVSTESHPAWAAAPAVDDTSIEDEPSRHVDYLLHDWEEEDILSSWRYVTSRRNDYSNGVRLENASWRTWAKAKHNLKTVSPESLNW
jgi:hypothetical protein